MAPRMTVTSRAMSSRGTNRVAVPYLDRGKLEPTSWSEAFSLRERRWAFVAFGLFWVIMIIGTVTNAVTPVG
ncbi:MAG: hypothetical protein JJE05_01520 [Actinobacteria bacterium]|nr:hypothetical protein [Actinomycetota bacterium]